MNLAYRERNAQITMHNVMEARDEAHSKAIDSLGRYKFEMFGYWASAWVKYNQLLPKPLKQANPFREFVKLARAHQEENHE